MSFPLSINALLTRLRKNLTLIIFSTELNVGMLAASLPSLRPLFTQYLGPTQPSPSPTLEDLVPLRDTAAFTPSPSKLFRKGKIDKKMIHKATIEKQKLWKETRFSIDMSVDPSKPDGVFRNMSSGERGHWRRRSYAGC